ncbi:VOC family protein [Solilutibacter silvestris]|uniref:VOC family protein n=1 Tax=Solilutibacter silvestris TaxID=1645665 RepID=UPI003D34F400
MRPLLLAATLAFAAVAAAPIRSATPAQPQMPATSIDHFLLWGRSIDQVSADMAVKLGFQVKQGRDPAGLANRYVRFADGSYIELLGITRANPELDPGAQADQVALKGAAGARTLGLRTTTLDRMHDAVTALGWKPTPVFDGPKLANGRTGWRLFAFEKQPLSSNLFLIDYDKAWAPDLSATPAPGDWLAARVHPNGARALTAYWLLSADVERDRTQLAALGLKNGKPIRLPDIAARGVCVSVGDKAILLLQPDGAGIAADALQSGGPQIIGASVAVADLARAQRLVERGYEHPVKRYSGTFGQSFLAPTRDDLGILLEFHAASAGKDVCGR